MRAAVHWLIAGMLGFAGAGSLYAQVFEVSAGASTQYGAEGGNVVIHGKDLDTTIGAGFVDGHFAAGGSSIRRIAGGTLTAGQQDLRMDLPTDVFDTSHIFYGTGLGLQRSTRPGEGLSLFGGLASEDGGSPLFRTSSLESATFFGQWHHQATQRCATTMTGIVSKTSAFLQSLDCSATPALHFAFTVGIGANHPYEAASLTLKKRRFNLRASYILTGTGFQRGNDLVQPNPEPVRENVTAEFKLNRRITLSGAHQNYLTPVGEEGVTAGLSMMPIRSSLDSASIGYQEGTLGVNVTVLHSTAQLPATPATSGEPDSNSALSASFRKTFGRFQWSENLLHTFDDREAASSLLVNGLAVALTPHLRLTESVNVTGTGTSFSHGGALFTSFSSFEVDYQILYLANRPANPFQQAMLFDAQIRLPRNLALHAASNIGPTGQTQYTVQLATLLAHKGALPEPLSQGGLGIYVVRGMVIDHAGKPIEGATLLIGTQRVYSDSAGIFFFREKHAATHPLHVLTDEFTGIGEFATESAPVQVRSSPEAAAPVIHIIMERVPTPTQTGSLGMAGEATSSPLQNREQP